MNKSAIAIVALAFMIGCSSVSEYRIKTLSPSGAESISEPSEREISEQYDFLDNSIFSQIPRIFCRSGKEESKNVDPFGQVLDSDWFTNRNAATPLSIEGIVKGPNKGDGPDTSGMWEVIKGKSRGVTVGFHVKDSRGDIYVIKFDPLGHPELASSSEVICTKFFYAAGYNTPENYIAVFCPDRLRVGKNAKFVDKRGVKRLMKQADLDEILSRVPWRDDAKIRVMASKYLSGKPKGPFSYRGRRRDDPEDLIPHEDRRELRGLGVICAWLNHVDIVGKNTLDMYVEDNGRKYLKHYLIDFGSTLGNASRPPHFEGGHEYTIDFVETLKSLFTFGIYKRSWEDLEFIDLPSIGYFESKVFEPARWKANYPNPAFQNMTNLDRYWGARVVASFSDEHIEAVVKSGHLTNLDSEKYLIRILQERRDKLVRYWYGKVNPLDNFAIAKDGTDKSFLHFEDLAVKAGFCSAEKCVYRCRLYHHNFQGKPELMTEYLLTKPPIALDGVIKDLVEAKVKEKDTKREDRYFFLEIHGKREKELSRNKYVRVHLYYEQKSQDFSIVGVEHEG
ncbi:hypothetical protein E3J62_12620 [candidate division TA06 bacterium]|uniref:Uncharacterized protein n=1 Tax=candidate division TA06 bacterium TaxID=2250710 RepID=A0A523UME0_UNCT6|nr:MAG: hypothetical protein E3J62_12620 [candidate division TA06 bacterium]